MGKKNRNRRNRLETQRIYSNPGRSLSIAILDVRKESNLEHQRNEDRISDMHDDILSHVISFLPFKSAVETSLLSTRWKDAWKRKFSEQKGSIDDAFAAISSFLHGCFDGYSEQKPTSNWGFVFNLDKRSFISVAADPDKALQLDFSNVNYGFPWLFDWSLAIHPLPFSYSVYLRLQFPTHSFSFEIKTLHLKSVSHIFSGAISSMMINFKCLESLTIEKCPGLRSFKLEADYEARLKKLTILDCQQLESVHINDPRLESLRFRGKLLSFHGLYGRSLPFWPTWFDHGIDLVDAMLDFRQGPHCSNIGSCGLRSFFRYNKDVKSLTLTGWIFEPLIYPTIESPNVYWRLQFHCLSELWWIDCSMKRFNSNALIFFLNLCPRLARLYITIDPKSHRRRNTLTNYSVEFIHVSRLEHLKVVKLEGFPNEKEEIRLAKRLKQEFHVEPLIIAKSNYVNCARLMVKADDVYEEEEDSFKFIEIRVEHLYDLCPKHPHMLI